MPELRENPEFDWQMFYGAYARTYIDRDVRELSEIGDTVKFTKFMVAAAASIVADGKVISQKNITLYVSPLCETKLQIDIPKLTGKYCAYQTYAQILADQYWKYLSVE